MNHLLQRRVAVLALLAATFAAAFSPQLQAQTCPFDDGNSSIEVEGLILTRYALGLTGAPLVANTNINAVYAPTVQATINCPSCGLNITGNPSLSVADATIISRKLADFSGAALTDNLALGSGTRNTPAAVQSFLLSGCGATGGTVTSIAAGSGLTRGTITTSGTIAADTNFLQRRLSTSCSAGSFITGVAADGAVTCGAPAGSAGGTVTNVTTSNGILGGPITATGTISADTTFLQRRVASNCAAGSGISAIAADGTVTCAATGQANAFVQGGNSFAATAVLGTNDSQPVTVKTNQSTIKLLVDSTNGDDGLRISYATQGNDISPNIVNGSRANTVTAGRVGATIAGGGNFNTSVNFGLLNQVNGNFGTTGGGYSNTIAASGDQGTIGGGIGHTVSGIGAVIGGGFHNTAGSGSGGQGQTVAGGNQNVASGDFSAVPGGNLNTAAGTYSFAAGRRAKATNQGAFVWGDSTNADVTATGNNQFVVRASGGIRLPGAGVNQPGNAAAQSGTNMFTHMVPTSGPSNRPSPW